MIMFIFFVVDKVYLSCRSTIFRLEVLSIGVIISNIYLHIRGVLNYYIQVTHLFINFANLSVFKVTNFSYFRTSSDKIR